MNTLLSLAFFFVIGNVVGLSLWGTQSIDWYRNSDLFKFVVILTSLTFVKLIWLFFYKTPLSSYNIYLTGSVATMWILVCLWIVASVFVTSVTNECINIFNNYYKYSIGNLLTCNGEIVTNTFTILLTLILIVIAVYIIQLFKVPREEVTVVEPSIQMQQVPNRQNNQNVELDMEEVPL